MIFYYFLLQKEGSRKRDKPCSDSFQSSPMKKMRSPSRRLSSPPPPPPPSTTTSSSSIRKPFLSSLNQQAGDQKTYFFYIFLICIGIYIDFHVFIFSQVSVFLKQTIESLQIIIFEKILVESSFLMLIKYNFSSWNGIFKILNFLCYFETFTPLNYTGCRYWHIACRRS